MRDLHRIFGREALVLSHNLVFSPRDTMRAVSRFSRALPGAFETQAGDQGDIEDRALPHSAVVRQMAAVTESSRSLGYPDAS